MRADIDSSGGELANNEPGGGTEHDGKHHRRRGSYSYMRSAKR